MADGMHQDFESPATFGFPMDGRDQWKGQMEEVGYVELPEFDDPAVRALIEKGLGYFCGTCEYMVKRIDEYGDPARPTGYWCKKFNFADRPHGCCDGWELVPKK